MQISLVWSKGDLWLRWGQRASMSRWVGSSAKNNLNWWSHFLLIWKSSCMHGSLLAHSNWGFEVASPWEQKLADSISFGVPYYELGRCPCLLIFSEGNIFSISGRCYGQTAWEWGLQCSQQDSWKHVSHSSRCDILWSLRYDNDGWIRRLDQFNVAKAEQFCLQAPRMPFQC